MNSESAILHSMRNEIDAWLILTKLHDSFLVLYPSFTTPRIINVSISRGRSARDLVLLRVSVE